MHQMIQDIISSAVSGPAIAYWAKGSNVVYEQKPDGSRGPVIAFTVRDGDPDGSGVLTTSKKVINERSILAARKLLMDQDCGVHRSIAAQFVGPMENWDFDSDGVDALVQVVLFGKAVYG